MADRVIIKFSTAAPCSFIPFTKGWPNRYSKMIRMLGHTYFSHVDFLIDRATVVEKLEFDLNELSYHEYLLGASNNPDAPVLSGNPRGVALRPPNYQEFGIRRRMIIKTDKADAILDFAINQIGKPFDSGALTPKVFLSDPFYGALESRDWRDPNQWFCAEMVICAFEAAEYWGPGVKVPVLKNRITPADLHMIFMMDPNFINQKTFLDPVPSLKMGRYEM